MAELGAEFVGRTATRISFNIISSTTMYLSQACRPTVISPASALRLVRLLRSSSGVPDQAGKPRQAPLALDLDGISLSRNTDPVARGKNFNPTLKDLGRTAGHVDQLLSTRLQRRLPESQRQPQVQANESRTPRPRQNERSFTPRSPNSRPGLARSNRAGAPRNTGRPSRSRGPIGKMDQAQATEPDVPLTPAELPPKRHNYTDLTALTTRPPSLSTKRGAHPSDPVQRIRETVGGDYSQWMPKEDIAAAGNEDVTAIARARLALAFNPTILPKDRKKLIDTTQMLLSKGRPSGSAASA
ncbi:alpha-ketoglutarate-dependent xanthine dioxygenase, putative [Rhizoctonia solani AG-3 Rhs1AP]|uniref:Alpha-ketoglutarate-dependent xanthine dioxygenase, putative n=1 Tax=Rhizoctonia solani AG-3 Rhs1AP TaxID=1086054 RepID=X8JVH0_9AGAM|nr:alpha-ketoglutarate-dependent xanthine dioxygenase, putative [Rhizoctonia solani AG-3 Rhs1AP]